MLISDSRLLLQYLAQKDNRAYRHLYQVYYTGLKILARGILKDERIADDLVQDVFISLLGCSHDFSSVDEVKNFLYSALKNKCIDYLRKEKLHIKYTQEVTHANEHLEDFWEKVLEEEVYVKLMTAINMLPPQCRLVMLLSLEGLKIFEIAGRLQISEATVKEHKKVGKSKLLQLLHGSFLSILIFSL